VCDKPLDAIPPSPGAAEVRAATRAEKAARTAQADAEGRINKAERRLDAACQDVTTAERRAADVREELARIERETAQLEAELSSALGELPDDPSAEIADRARRLEELTRAAAQAVRAAADADRALREATDATGRIIAEAGAARGSLEAMSFSAAVARAVLIDEDLTGPDGGELPPATDLPLLVAAATERAERARAYADRLAGAATERLSSEPGFQQEASEVTEGLLPPGGSLADLVKALSAAVRDAIRDDEQRRNEVAAIENALKTVASLRAEATVARERGRVFKELAQELKADRLIAFLQQEALELLAIEGSGRLTSLSGGRYELVYRADEFLVVDRWNGDETRSVRTLSGGETFLASLALALALARQVASLAVTRHASLDSLFLDEGFGTLDPDTLEVVIEAIERLGGDGQVVGVITHVRELADRMPARIEIDPSERGSTIRQAV
jgi:exonuclease SbcC